MARNGPEGIIFAGQVPHERVRDYYALIDLFVFPRRRMRLTELVTPLKPLESMAMAKAVLASDVGGHRELIQDEATGILFAADSQEALVNSATRAVQDSELRRRLGAAGRNYVATERNWPTLVQRYVKLYADLAAGSNAPNAAKQEFESRRRKK
jgi:glycosyltransferase involved in cell wall biosynthesis